MPLEQTPLEQKPLDQKLLEKMLPVFALNLIIWFSLFHSDDLVDTLLTMLQNFFEI